MNFCSWNCIYFGIQVNSITNVATQTQIFLLNFPQNKVRQTHFCEYHVQYILYLVLTACNWRYNTCSLLDWHELTYLFFFDRNLWIFTNIRDKGVWIWTMHAHKHASIREEDMMWNQQMWCLMILDLFWKGILQLYLRHLGPPLHCLGSHIISHAIRCTKCQLQVFLLNPEPVETHISLLLWFRKCKNSLYSAFTSLDFAGRSSNANVWVCE